MKKRILILSIAVVLLLALTSCVHTHEYSEEWTADETHHWHECSCGAKTGSAEHFGGTATESEQAICEACGQAYGELVAHEHNYNAVVTAPTCTEAGYTTYTCACGDSYVGDDVAAKGHSYDASVTAPTCTEAGYTTYTCACGDSYVGDDVAAKGHSYDVNVTAPTCAAEGYTTYTCTCGDSYVADKVPATGHNIVNYSDDTYHWSACSYECGEATEKVPHNVKSIAVNYNESDMMENLVLTLDHLTVIATCDCDKEYAVTDGVEIIADALVCGDNNVTVKVGDASVDLVINASKFYKVVNGDILEDTHINSGYNGTSYGERTELYIYNTGMYRVFFRFNFTDALNSEYYAEFGDEAIVQFSFTVTNGVDLTGLPITFKSYLTSELRSSVNLSDLTWGNYSNTYTLGWGTEDDNNNTVSLLSKEVVGDRATYVDGKLVITITLRELEGCIDENGNAIFVLLTAQKDVKPYVASMENTEFDIPAVKVIYSNDHAHAYIEHVVDEKYLASANCGEQAKYFVSCSCGEAGTETFNHGEVIEHAFGEFVETTAPSCTAEGVNTKTCDKCGATETENIPVIPHSHNANVTDPTCTLAGYTTYTCICGDSYVADQVEATGHSYGEWLYDESYHWVACHCGDVADKSTHEGGEATETEQAVCDTCKQPYGGLASHVHNYSSSVTAPTCTTEGYTTYTCDCGDVYVGNKVDANGHSFGVWESLYPATCEGNEVLVHYCDCGESETGVGQAAFGHDMQTKHDENNHWTECAHNCGKSTDPVAHFGGEATETEYAVCEGCGQSYGELKAAEKKEYSINATVKDDTYVMSGTNSGKNYAGATELNVNSEGTCRVLFRVNFNDILASADYNADSDAKVRITFSFTTTGALKDSSTITLRLYNPSETRSAIDFSTLKWSNYNTAPNDLGWGTNTDAILSEVYGNKVAYDAESGKIVITLSYSDFVNNMDANNDVLFVFAIKQSGTKIASSEHSNEALRPKVEYVYSK